MELNKQEYGKYVKEVTPTNPLLPNMLRAFISGGLICLLGQALTTGMMEFMGMDKQTAQTWTLLELILLSIILTGLGVYPRIVKWGGAGALVPITGFANSVAAPAIEYQAEGQVFGIGCKIFTIAGPVILYGIFSSWILGLIYWALKMMGVV